jgi:mannitol/fructose-specific phosphotransferase system IIA component (Ntr-type)
VPHYGVDAVPPPTELIAQPDVVTLDLVATSREAALRALHGQLSRNPAVKDADRFLFDLLDRVMLSTVCIAADVALPHARTTAVERIVLGIARIAAPGVGFDGEHPHVRLMFLIGTPKQQVEEYLRVVAGISRLLKTDGVHAGLLSATNEMEFRAILARAGTP